MATTVGKVLDWVEELAPSRFAASWDNVGLLLGDRDQDVDGVLTALTVTEEVVGQAIRENCRLIVAHHPVIFRPLNRVHSKDPVGRILYRMIRADIACVAAHTNLDAAVGGVNDALAERLGVEAVTPLEAGEHGATYGIGRIGQLATAMSAEEFVLHVKKSLKLSNLRTCGDGRRQVERVAVVGGAGGSFVQIAANLGADVLVTGDVDYHDADLARALGLWVVDAGHFGTEKHVPVDLAAYIARRASADGIPLRARPAIEEDAIQP